MCDPVTAAGLALSAGGTFLQQQEANSNAKAVQNAKNDAFAADMIRQRGYADEAGAAFNHNVNNNSKEQFEDKRTQEASRIEQAFNERRVQPDYNVGAAPNTLPKNVVLARKDASDKAGAETDRDNKNNADLQSYGGTFFNQGLDQSAFSRLFGNIQDKAGADAALTPIRIQAAGTNAQKAPSLFPTLLKLAGGAASAFGSAGGSFSNTTSPVGPTGPVLPQTSYGLFMDGKPVNLFGYDLNGRYS